MRLLLIRHGQSVANTEGRLQGQMNSPLTEKGQAQAHALARRLEREARDISVIYTSDLSRAAETARIIGDLLGAAVVLDERLREYDAGVLNGLIFHEIERLYPEVWEALHDDSTWAPIPGSEGNPALCRRLAAAVDDMIARHSDGQTVVIVSHGGSLGVLLAHLLGMDTHRPTPFRFGNASLSALEVRPGRLRLTALNDTCHLDGDLR